MFRRSTLVMFATLTIVTCSLTSASATFPGANGRVAYTNVGGQIASVKPDGTGKKTLTHLTGMSFVEAPTYSPDGAWIVFDADDGGGANLYLMRSDGTHVHPVADTPGYDWAPSWSPDGRWIVYSKDGSGSPIMVVQRDGTHRHRVGTGLGEYARYSPDGTKIAYGGSDNQIHVMRSDGSNDHAITNAGGNDYPDWSPGGRLIGFTSDLSGTSQVWVARPDGSHARQVTTSGANYSPSFSPDGTRVAYLTSTTGSPVWSALLDGTHVRTIVGATGGCCIGWQAIRGTG